MADQAGRRGVGQQQFRISRFVVVMAYAAIVDRDGTVGELGLRGDRRVTGQAQSVSDRPDGLTALGIVATTATVVAIRRVREIARGGSARVIAGPGPGTGPPPSVAVSAARRAIPPSGIIGASLDYDGRCHVLAG